MTLVLTTNVVGQRRGEPVRLPNRRRRLSTVVARHRPPAGRPFIVSVHRRGDPAEIYRPDDRTVRLRATWSKTLVGPQDVVVVTAAPLGKGVASIGLAIASIALIALAPYAAPLIAGSALFGAGAAAGGLTTAIQAGLVIGGVALGYAAQASKASGTKKNAESYSITGGGNVPKPGARKPLLYGKRWSSPPLSQGDFVNIDGDSTVLVKRMTLGLGKFQIHRIRVADALFWDEASGIQAPFNTATGPFGAAIEFLYEQPSTIAPGDIIASPSVGGQELPRPGGNPSRTPWFRLAPQGVSVDAAQMDWTYPAIYRLNSEGKEKPTSAGVVFYGREIDPNTGAVIGPEFEAHRSIEGTSVFIRTPLRRVAYFRLPKSGAYEISAANAYPEAPASETQENRVVWDAMYAFEDDTRIRPQTTEIVLRMRAGKGLTVTA
ncbi:phage tail protein, partial [Methylobacterium sp. J-068]|nr:phage tail protein [Methylobacterium sp. J-068]